MVVIGTDAHKRNYACAAVASTTGAVCAQKEVVATRAGHEALIAWARKLDSERVWAVEDCRGVSAKLERFLLARGERVIRISPRLAAGRRRGSRTRGKSDQIDALSIARTALEDGVDTFPAAQLAGPAREIQLLLGHRENLVAERTRLHCRVHWLLHDRWPELVLPVRALNHASWRRRILRKLAAADQAADVRVMRDQIKRIAEITKRAAELERELAILVVAQQPRLLELPGVGTLNAAKMISEIAGIERFSSPAKLARLAGIAPIPASSGARHRVRLDRGGNRQLNTAVHRMAICQLSCHQPAKDYVARKITEGKSKREAIRCLKRHLIRSIYHAMAAPPDQGTLPTNLT